MSIEKNTPNLLKHEELGFTTNINETINGIRDGLALGIFIYLSSKPANWNICKKQLQSHFGIGRDSIDKVFKYLKSLGLLEVKSNRDSSGQITFWETTLKRKISPPSVEFIQITENPYSGKKTRSLKNQNLVSPEPGKTAPINKRRFKNNGVIKKTNNVPVFFETENEVKAYLDNIILNRDLNLSNDFKSQILFYIGEDRQSLVVTKKINIALKKIREKKWNIPHGYNGITSQSIRENEELQQKAKLKQYQEDTHIIQAIHSTITHGGGFKEFSNMLHQLKKDVTG